MMLLDWAVDTTDLITSDVFWYGRRVLSVTGTSDRTWHTGSHCRLAGPPCAEHASPSVIWHASPRSVILRQSTWSTKWFYVRRWYATLVENVLEVVLIALQLSTMTTRAILQLSVEGPLKFTIVQHVVTEGRYVELMRSGTARCGPVRLIVTPESESSSIRANSTLGLLKRPNVV